jgi:hypothetical protein
MVLPMEGAAWIQYSHDNLQGPERIGRVGANVEITDSESAQVAGQSIQHASDPQLNALKSFANVVGLDLDDPEDRDHCTGYVIC